MLELTIKTDNAAFEGAALYEEVARILRSTADRIAGHEEDGTLRDANGNNVGHFFLDSPDEDDEDEEDEDEDDEEVDDEDVDRAEWVNNDEGLYNWWKGSRQTLRDFLRENRKEVQAWIDRALNQKPVR